MDIFLNVLCFVVLKKFIGICLEYRYGKYHGNKLFDIKSTLMLSYKLYIFSRDSSPKYENDVIF